MTGDRRGGPGEEAGAGPAPARLRPGGALLLAALAGGAAALALGAAGRPGGLEPFLPLLLAPAFLPLGLPPAPAAVAHGLVAAVPLLLRAAGLAPGLAPGRYLLLALPAWAAVALWRLRLARLRERLREERAERAAHEATDALTGVAVRRELVRQGQQLVALARRGARPLAVLALDVDRLSAINARHQLAVGDEVLRSVAARLREAVRATDLVGRTGDDRFAVVMPDTEAAGVRAAGERVRAAVAEDGLFAPGTREEVRFTVSVGLALLAAGDEDLEAVLGRAEEAVAGAKRAGRDRVEESR